ncbi:MAG: L-threonylcarbamoyladenylate synthase [Candidatus Altimarinota bacterium]
MIRRITETRAVDELARGEVIIVPTDTVFGLAADYQNLAAVKKIYQLKGRSENKPLAMLVGSVEMLKEIVEDVRPVHKLLMQKFWPGGLTLIFRKKVGVSDLITAGGDRVGVRMPAHQGLVSVIKSLGRPIVATSVNKSGENSLNDLEKIAVVFPDLEILENKENVGGTESSVLDLSEEKPRLLREGAVSKEELEDVLGMKLA